MKMFKSLEGKMGEEQLRSLGWFSPEDLRGGLMVAAVFTGSRGLVLSSAICWQQQGLMEQHGAVSGEGPIGVRDRFCTKVWWALGHAPQGSGHSPKLPEFKKCLDNTLTKIAWILCSPVWSQGFVSMILMCPFHLRIFYDSFNSNIRSNWHQLPGNDKKRSF